MARRLSLSLLLLAVGAAVLVAAGIAWPAGSAPVADAEARKGGTLRVGSPDDVAADPNLEWGLTYAACAKLFNYPDRSGAAGTQVIPEVVRTTTKSRDGRVYTFDLKRTFRFHTGAPVTARSFAEAFNRVADPRLKSDGAAYMREIVGAVAVMNGNARAISGVRVLAPYRLQVRLTAPVGDFTARLTLPNFCPVLPNTPVRPAQGDIPAGSGPYYEDEAERVVNRRVVLKRNPFYGGDRQANVDRIDVTIGVSSADCLLAVEQDRIDYCTSFSVPPAAWRRLAKRYAINRPGGQVFVEPMLSTGYLAFNHERPAFKGPGQIALKKAINYAIDRPDIIARALGYLGGEPTDQMLPPALTGRDQRIYPLQGADLATARKLYAQARRKPRTLVFYSTNKSIGAANVQALTSYLKRIGITVVPRFYDSELLREKVGRRGEPYDLYITGWGVGYADPAAAFGPLLDPDLKENGNTNFAYYSNPRVTARIEAANRLPAGAARRKAWADLDEYLMRNDPPWAPLTHQTTREFVSRSYGCFVNQPLYGVDFAVACKK